MILYVQFDIKNGALRMLQIPATALSPPRTKNHPFQWQDLRRHELSDQLGGNLQRRSIAALADVIYDQFRLPIDYYVTVDMQALVDMVDNFGGIEVYIPHDMSYGAASCSRATAI